MIQPDPSFSIHLALPRRSWHLPLDDRLRAFSKRFCPTWLLYPFLALWCMAFILLIRQQYYVGNIGVISCDAAVWADWPPDTCGIDGFACLDQLEEGTYRCLGGCQGVPLGNPRWVGGVSVDGIPLVIGGNDSIYRADSWVCPSAIHAGLVSPTLGGVITVKPLPFIWGHSDFTSSKAHGIQSVGFEPKYPGAYRLVSAPLNGNLDLHPIISTVNALCLAIVTLFLRPSPPILFSILVVLGWFQLTLISDPASFPPDWGWVAGGIPLVLLTAYWAYRVAFQRTLTAFRDLPLDTTIWQGAGYWIGLESSTIFAKLPISRLGYGGLSADGVIALVLILIVVLIVVLIQAWQMRRYGLLQYYLIRYLPLAPILLILAFIPGYTLRIHHYLYCLAAIPVLSLPNRVSLFGQAFILGLFLDGVGRWGWASILQQTTSLIGDANTGTYVPFPLNTSTITDISWEPITQNLTEMGYTGVAVMVDDILRAIVNSSSE
ncbi:hypothetical protein BD324DRAFT_575252 [Kockovaella imperatae]|uniref:LCCL domain-containing protein n=1 Tax=Kockovaella imperatae TaxID=4999 RepID=A0A1Y1UTX4_9TREE|nr:hypothetical protein BD324DRAFT_575252 [Kockovaella imperatae]ORX40876.1 hypothetical protein BD324DRAFT_575252 [Kockovaella imperatae]